MPYAVGSFARGRVKSIAGRSPFPAGFLAHQNETGSARTRHPSESGRNKLTPPTHRVDQTSYRLGQVGRFRGSILVIVPPGFEQLGDFLAVWIMGFQHFDPLDRISTTKRQQWIAHPIAPGLKAAERPTAFEFLLILPTIAPDRQGGRQQVNQVLLDLFEDRHRAVVVAPPARLARTSSRDQ
jgi:hypothetical protein